jgi:hypothetical protein
LEVNKIFTLKVKQHCHCPSAVGIHYFSDSRILPRLTVFEIIIKKQSIRKNVAANYRKINSVGPPKNRKTNEKENENPNYVFGQYISKFECLMKQFQFP